MKAIWPDTFVEDANLTVNISLLRKALGETEDGRPYIETVPRKGYRFNAPVVTLDAEAQGVAAPGSAILEASELPEGRASLLERGKNNQVFPGVSAGERSTDAVARKAAIREIIPFPDPRRTDDRGGAVAEAATITPRPTAQDEGREDAGSSADTPAAPRSRWPTTQDEGRPNADSAARFWRWLASIVVAAALVIGGLVWHHVSRPAQSAQLIQRRLTSFAPEMTVTAAAISTGGKFVAYANPSGLFIQVIATGDTQVLALPTPHFRVSSVSWFPDSARLLVDGSSAGDASPTLWIVPVIGTGRPVEVGPYPAGVVSPDGSQIAWVNGRSLAPEIQVMRSGEHGIQTVVRGAAGEVFGAVNWSPNGRHLVFTRYFWNPQFRGNTGSIESYEMGIGKTKTLLSGHDFGGDAVSLPDGRLVYSMILGANPSAYGSEIMCVHTDPRTGEATGSPSVIAQWYSPVTGLTVNESGTRLAFRDLVLQHSAYVGELEGGGRTLSDVRRLSFGVGREDYPRAWTANSKAVFLDSNRAGNWEIFKQPLDSETDRPFVQGPEDQFSPRIAPDGASLLYIQRPREWHESEPATIMRAPISGGVPRVVLQASGFTGWGLRFDCPTAADLPCVLAQRQGNQIVFRTFDPNKGFQSGSNELARTQYVPDFRVDWCLAPDGLKIAWIDMNATDNHIHIVPLARSGTGVVSQGKQRSVTVSGGAYLHAITWSPDERGWFIIRQFPESWTLIYETSQGKSFPLLTVPSTFPTDVFPSPDGHYLAFSEQTFTSNVWLLEHF